MNKTPADAANLEFDGMVARLTLNRPEKHNAFDDKVIAQLLTHLESVAARDDIRALILSAEGKHFCAGADLAWMKRMAGMNYQENLADAKQLAKLMSTLDALPVPTIAKVQGAAYGGAIGLIACCDIAIASDTARFCLSEVKLGLAPATIGPFVLRAMGERRCRQLFITAEVFNAQQANNWGLVHHLAQAEELDGAVEDCVQSIVQNGPSSCRAAKQLIQQLSSTPDPSDMTSRLIAELRVSEEGQEGLGAFFEKRKPVWQI